MHYFTGAPQAWYQHTNESIPGVLHGLDVQLDDRILAICGSGDIPFAMIAQGAHVVAFDNCPGQIAYAQRRAELLRRHEYKEFLRTNSSWDDVRTRAARDNFFTPRIIRAVRHNLCHIHFEQWDLLEGGSGTYEKVYISNAGEGTADPEQRILAARRFVTGDGLLLSFLRLGRPPPVVEGLAIDEVKTSDAQAMEPRGGSTEWAPTVYRKVA